MLSVLICFPKSVLSYKREISMLGLYARCGRDDHYKSWCNLQGWPSFGGAGISRLLPSYEYKGWDLGVTLSVSDIYF